MQGEMKHGSNSERCVGST